MPDDLATTIANLPPEFVAAREYADEPAQMRAMPGCDPVMTVRDDIATDALLELAERLEKAEKRLQRLREAEASARRQEFWNNEGDADAIRRDAIRSALGLEIGDDLKLAHLVVDKLDQAEATIERNNQRWQTQFVAQVQLKENAEAELADLTQKSHNWGTMMHELMTEKENAEARISELTQDRLGWAARCVRTENALKVTTRRAEKAEAERDLAIAHDRQPYPTAWAYEKVCETLSRVKADRDRWRYLAEKATWCFHEGMFLCGYGQSRSGSWFPEQVVTRWNDQHRDERLERYWPKPVSIGTIDPTSPEKGT